MSFFYNLINKGPLSAVREGIDRTFLINLIDNLIDEFITSGRIDDKKIIEKFYNNTINYNDKVLVEEFKRRLIRNLEENKCNEEEIIPSEDNSLEKEGVCNSLEKKQEENTLDKEGECNSLKKDEEEDTLKECGCNSLKKKDGEDNTSQKEGGCNSLKKDEEEDTLKECGCNSLKKKEDEEENTLKEGVCNSLKKDEEENNTSQKEGGCNSLKKDGEDNTSHKEGVCNSLKKDDEENNTFKEEENTLKKGENTSNKKENNSPIKEEEDIITKQENDKEIIYILLLENSKYYIGKTKNLDLRLKQHFNDSVYGAIYTKKYKPLKLIETFPIVSIFCEDKYVKIYMEKYGINNVRGGTYSQEFLSQDAVRLLEKEIIHAKGLCLNCGLNGHFAKDCQLNINNIEYTKITNNLENNGKRPENINTELECTKITNNLENNGKRWTVSDEKILMNMYTNNASIKEITNKLKRTEGAIQSRIDENIKNNSENNGKRWSVSDEKILIDMYTNNTTIKEIANKLKRTEGAIQSRIDENIKNNLENNGKRWTIGDEKILMDMHNSGNNIKIIAYNLKRTEGAIQSRIEQLLKKNKGV